MQIMKFSPIMTVVLIFITWPIIQFIISIICLKVSDKYLYYDSKMFRLKLWEKNGEIYNTLFKVKFWKKYLPDGGAIMKGYKKKYLKDTSVDNLEKYLLESCRSELQHWLSIFPFWIFGLFAPAKVIPYMFIYALLSNIPCIAAQRYNRPRIIRLLERMKKRSK